MVIKLLFFLDMKKKTILSTQMTQIIGTDADFYP
jgi:hypothetical protein